MIEINQIIKRENLPKEGCFLDEFQKKYPKLNLKPLAGRNSYYKSLSSLSEEEKEEMGVGENQKHIWIVEGNGDGKSASDLTEGQREVLRSQMEGTISNLAEEVSKSVGNVPAEIDALIKGFKKPKPSYDYKKYIRNFVGNSTKYLLKTTRAKENQRFEGQPRLILKPKSKIAVYTDESGSVSEKELKECLNEIYHLSKKDYEIDIFPFDTGILKKVTFDPMKDLWKRSLCGGTDPTCCVEHYLEHKEYNSAIIFTDGYFSEVKKCMKPMLWVISSNGTTDSVKNQTQVIKIPVTGE